MILVRRSWRRTIFLNWATGNWLTYADPTCDRACCAFSATVVRSRPPALWPQTVITAEDPVLETRELALVAYLRRQRPPLGIVAYDDLAAVATLRAANTAGWRVPEDLSVIGIDDIPFAAYTNPGLTSVAQPKPELGALAVDLVLDGDDASPGTRVLDGHLVVRQSTARAPEKTTRRRQPVAQHQSSDASGVRTSCEQPREQQHA